MSTTTLDLGGAQLTVDTQALFRAWMEKNLASVQPALPICPTPNAGERYVGTILRADGTGHHLYRPPLQHGLKMPWHQAIDYATTQGAELPDRVESALLFATREDGEFEHEWYWTREQLAGYDAYAWCQFFVNGGQSNCGKYGELRVVLVRRVAIQSFSHCPAVA